MAQDDTHHVLSGGVDWWIDSLSRAHTHTEGKREGREGGREGGGREGEREVGEGREEGGRERGLSRQDMDVCTGKTLPSKTHMRRYILYMYPSVFMYISPHMQWHTLQVNE